MKKVNGLGLYLIILFVSILSFTIGYYFKDVKLNSQNQDIQTKPEIEMIKTSSKLDERVKYYKKLIDRVGTVDAQEQLLKSGLPFDGETHLLNHTVGDFLYEKYGREGLTFCRDYFLSSCYHGFVIRALSEGGISSLKEVMSICKSKGEHVAIQCSHAIGHGFLAYDGYKNLLQALSDCDNLASESKDFPLFNCHDGVFMENIFAVHEDGKPSEDRWLKSDDLMYPCNEIKIPDQYKRACWSNQPSWMFQQFKGDLKRVAEQCYKLTDSKLQTTCFDALARQIHPLTKGSVDETLRMCSLMPSEWIDPCIVTITKAFFSVGDRVAPFELCFRIRPESKDRCYSELNTIISLYVPNFMEKKAICDLIKDKGWVESCRNSSAI